MSTSPGQPSIPGWQSRSRVTGTMTVAGLVGDELLYLRDNAVVVPVTGRYELGALTSYRRADGQRWETFCCCGPAAPFPGLPPAVGPDGLPVWLSEAHPEATGWERVGDPVLRRWRAKVPGWSSTLPPVDLLVVVNEAGTGYMRFQVDLTDLVDPQDAERRVRENLEAALAYEGLPTCEAPGCSERAPTTFTAAEPGQLAGKPRDIGDRIVFCTLHGYDVLKAGYGVDQVAEWLRPDMAVLDWHSRLNTAYDQHAGLTGPDRSRLIRAVALEYLHDQPPGLPDTPPIDRVH